MIAAPGTDCRHPAARPLRKHPVLLVLRYAGVALLAVLGGVLLFVTSRPAPAESPFADHGSDYYIAEAVTYAAAGILSLAAAAQLAWLSGPPRRWLLLAGAAVAAAPVVTVAHYVIVVSESDQRLADGLAEGELFLLLAGIVAVIVYPASRFGRRRVRYAIAWLLAWLALLLSVLTASAFWDYTRRRDLDGSTPLVLGTILAPLTAGASSAPATASPIGARGCL